MSKSIKLSNLAYDLINLVERPGTGLLVLATRTSDGKLLAKLLSTQGFEAFPAKSASEAQKKLSESFVVRGLIALGDRARSELAALKDACPDMKKVGALLLSDETAVIMNDNKIVTTQTFEIVNPANAEEASKQ